MEALSCLMWDAFNGWYTSHVGDGEERLVDEDSVKRKAEECRCAITMEADVQSTVDEFQQETTELHLLFQDFTTQSRATSKMFALWGEYGEMVKLLLQFVKAERTRNWELHLLSVSAMVPQFFVLDMQNYARWLPVYIMDMRQLATKHLQVHQEFANGYHAVSHSGKPFAQVWTDMALEQTTNADKSKGG